MNSKKYDFVAIDCEKASNEPLSLCSIGIACFRGGRVQDSKEYIIKPYPFKFYSGAVVDGCYHNVPVKVYEEAPTLAEVWPKIKKFFKGNILVGHGINGDLQAIQSTLAYYGIKYEPPSQNECICTNIASIYTYPDIDSHKLKTLCERLEININPHHALSDAKAAGFLLLDMMNVSDCTTAAEFIDVCNEYNELVTLNITDNNIDKYEEKIKEYFNYSDEDIQMVYKSKLYLINTIMDFYQTQRELMIHVDFKMCLSPIIELYRNPDLSDYSDEVNRLIPFTHDNFLYIRLGQDKYLILVGLLIDKTTLIFELLSFLSRSTISIPRTDYKKVSYKRTIKYRETINLVIDYLYDVEEFEEDDIFSYIEYLYMNQYEFFKGYDFIKQYSLILKNADISSRDLYSKTMLKLAKLVGYYLGLKDNFPERMRDVPKISQFNGTFSLFDEICNFIEFNYVSEKNMGKYLKIINDWYYENIEAAN